MSTSRLRDEIEKRSSDLKKNIKELNNIMSNLYNREQKEQSENLHNIRQTVNNISSAYKHISSVAIENSRPENKDTDIREDIEKLQKVTLSNILLLNEFYKEKLREQNRKTGSNEFNMMRKNMDSLKLAYNNIKRLDTDMNIKDDEWTNIEKDI